MPGGGYMPGPGAGVSLFTTQKIKKAHQKRKAKNISKFQKGY
jgi:hypothetical protein